MEQQLEMMEAAADEKTREHELTPYVMSIPGVGIGIASVLPVYLGDGKRNRASRRRRPTMPDLRRGRTVRGRRTGTGL